MPQPTQETMAVSGRDKVYFQILNALNTEGPEAEETLRQLVLNVGKKGESVFLFVCFFVRGSDVLCS